MSRAHLRQEDGVTLTETLITLLLMGIVGAVVVLSLVQGSRTSARSRERAEAVSELQLAMERISREVRAADPLVVAEADEISMDVNRAGQVLRLAYALSADDLVETRSVGGVVTGTTTLAEDVVDFSLTYRDEAGAALPTPVAAGSLGAVVRVSVHIERFIQGVPTPIELETTVHLRNTS